MSRYTDANCKLCRREGQKLFLKGDKIAEIRYVQLTETGVKFDPDEDERRKAQERLEATAARKEARRLEKEERAKRNSVL